MNEKANDAASQARLLRVFNILVNCLERLQHTRPVRPELLELTERVVDQFISRSYTLGRIDCCATVSQIEVVIKNMMRGFRYDEASLDSIHNLHLKLLGTWADEVMPELLGTPEGGRAKVDPAPPDAAGDGQQIHAGDRAAADTEQTPDAGDLSEKTGCFEYFLQDEFQLDEELLDIFIADIDEQTASMMSIILDLESTGGDNSSIQNLFRVLHTVKGNAGFLGLEEIFRLVHAMEDYIQPYRDKKLDPSLFSPDMMLIGVDVVVQLKENLKRRINAIRTSDQTEQLVPVDWRTITNDLLRASAAGVGRAQDGGVDRDDSAQDEVAARAAG